MFERLGDKVKKVSMACEKSLEVSKAMLLDVLDLSRDIRHFGLVR